MEGTSGRVVSTSLNMTSARRWSVLRNCSDSAVAVLSVHQRLDAARLQRDLRTMSRDFEELDYRETTLGELILRRRRMLSLGGMEIYEVKLGDAFLMSSLFHEVEEALARLGLAELKAEHWDVVVGGLGLGYTAVAALEHREVASLLVVDALAPVIEWHQQGLVPLGQRLTSDPRTRMLCADFFALAQSADGFDLERPGRKFHAVLLDIDHSPRNLLHPRNAAFYEANVCARSLRICIRAESSLFGPMTLRTTNFSRNLGRSSRPRGRT